jgi:acyl-CoA synthetase (AMP-forming)/AMP-acid ligase II
MPPIAELTVQPGRPSTSNEPAAAAHNAGGWIARWADERPHSLAWVDADRRCDYATAEDRVRRLAAWLEVKGVGPGDRVALWLGNRGAMLEAIFATARLAAIVLPINARLTAPEVAFQLEDATPSILMVERRWRNRATQACRLARGADPMILEVGLSDDDSNDTSATETDPYEIALASIDGTSRIHPVRPDAPMILMYTSGTTGKPKGALLPHRKTLYNSLNAEEYFGIQANDRVLVVAPLFHSLGLQILALPAIFKGAGLIIQEGFSAQRVWAAIESEAVTYYGGVPTMHQRLLDALDRGDPVAEPPSSLRFAFTAGAAAAPELIQAFRDRGLALRQGYGQTETSILTCVRANQSEVDSDAGTHDNVSVGRPVRHAELRLIAPDSIDDSVSRWRDVPPGVVGEIVVHGPITMLGYWRRPEATAETLREGWVRTGDLATRDDDFEITLVGRSREMYISGGENVYPAEVEAVLVEHPDIEEAAVIAIPDPEWGETGRAHVVLRSEATTRPAHLLEWLKTRLARFKQPREIILEAELPRTASGKVQKHLLGQDPNPAKDAPA